MFHSLHVVCIEHKSYETSSSMEKENEIGPWLMVATKLVIIDLEKKSEINNDICNDDTVMCSYLRRVMRQKSAF